MRICFSARDGNNVFTPRLFNILTANYGQNIEASFITLDEKETMKVKNTVEKQVDVFQLNLYIKKYWDEINIQELAYFEKKYDCAPIWKFIYTDRFLVNYNYEYTVKTVIAHFRFFENIFENNKFDFYYDEAIATLHSYVAYIVSKTHGTIYISQMIARGFDSEYHYFLSGPYQGNKNFRNDYIHIEYPTEIVRKAEEFLDNFEKKDNKPRYMEITGKRPKLSLKMLKLLAAYIKGYFSKRHNDSYVYLYYKGYKSILDPITFYFRYKMSRKYYNEPDYSNKYVYFPLHYQPEASTLVCSEKYEKQLYYIDSLAKSLPSDTLLYVKEHYAKLGHRELGFYKSLSKYPNVILIDPWENSRKLQMNSVAVTTLTGTVGFEAMLLRKPVFIGGSIFFENAPGVNKIEDIFDAYIQFIDNWKAPSRDEIIKFLCEYITSIYEGNANYVDPLCLEDRNLEKLAISLINQINKEIPKTLYGN